MKNQDPIELIDGKYKDINLKFAIISCLNEEGLHIEKAEAIKDAAYETKSFEKLGYDDIVPKVYKHYEKLAISQEELEMITEFNPSASNDCYNLLVKEWSGEDDIFDIQSLDGIEFLPNLEIFNPYGLLDYELDINALLLCKKLKTVHREFIPDTDDTEKVLAELEQKGIEIV